MNPQTHPVEQEEVMAYLDGELAAERAAVVAKHMDECADCRALAANLRGVSQQMLAWQVEPSSVRLAERVTAAPEAASEKAKPTGKTAAVRGEGWRRHFRMRPWAWGLAGACAVAVLVVLVVGIGLRSEFSSRNVRRSKQAAEEASRIGREFQAAAEKALQDQENAGTLGKVKALGATPASSPEAGPMIARTASLTIVAKDFPAVRQAVDAIVRRHQGYVANLTTTSPQNAAQTLTATLRIPAPRLDAALAELKKLGRVEQESQGGEEVTQQYVDLVARLKNARNTEQRLIEVLQQRTGKVKDVLEVEKEMARVREEIEQMDAERKSLEKRVQFATLNLRVSEEYKAQLEVTPPSTGTRLRNELVAGYGAAAEGVLGVILFLLGYGPSLVLWALVLYWPGRLAWRRWRAAVAARHSSLGAV